MAKLRKIFGIRCNWLLSIGDLETSWEEKTASALEFEDRMMRRL
jgi:hypothetical protein